MFEAYAVGVTLRVNNLVSAELAQMARDFMAVEGYCATLRAGLKAATADAKALSAALRGVNTANAPGRRADTAAANEAATAHTRATAAAQTYRSELVNLHRAKEAAASPPPGYLTALAVMSARQTPQPSALAPAVIPQAMRAPTMPPGPPTLPLLAAAYPQYGPLALRSRMAMAAESAGTGSTMAGPQLLADPAGMPYTPFRTVPPGGTVGGGGAGGAGNGGRPGGGGPGNAGGGGRGGFHGGAIHMGPGGIGIGPVGMSAGGALLPIAVTAASVWGGKALYEAARDYETAYTRFRTLNLGAEVNKQANDFARGSRVFGVASKDLMETVRESVGMFGSMPNALKVAPMLAQLNAANSGLFGGKIGAIDEGAARSLMRFNDMRGLTDSPEDFTRGLNLAQRMVTGSGGALKFTDLEQMAKRGGAAFKGLSDDGIMMLATLAQEQGGATTGTALMSLYQNLVAGRTTKKTMSALSEAGLVTLGSVTTGAVGEKKTTSTQITSIKDEKMLRENPGLWLMTYGTQAAQASGARTDSEVVAFMNKLVSNRVGSNMAANFTTQGMQAMRDFNLTKNAMGADQTVGAWKQTLGGKEAEFIASWNNFKTEFGTAALPAFSSLLTNGANFLRGINSFMESPAIKTFIGVYEKGFKWQGSVLSNLFSSAPMGQAAPAGGFVASQTEGGAFLGTRSPIRGAPQSMIQVESTTVLDGRAIAKTVSQHQAKELQRPQTGPRTADGRQSLRAFDISTGG